MEGIANHPEHKGITPRAFEHIFQDVDVQEDAKFLVRASYLEIYNENVRDLLGKDVSTALELKEHPERGVYVKDLSMVRWAILRKGEKNKIMDHLRGRG
jgi:hypothetical protein